MINTKYFIHPSNASKSVFTDDFMKYNMSDNFKKIYLINRSIFLQKRLLYNWINTVVCIIDIPDSRIPLLFTLFVQRSPSKMDHNCSLSGPLSYAVFIDINESRNPNSYKLLKRSSSFQFYQKRISNATNSSIHSINEVDKPSDLRKNGLADFDTFLVTARKTMPERFQSISNKHHSLRAHTSLQTTTNPSNSCSIPIKNFKKCCENNMGFNDYYEPIQISASVPNTSYEKFYN